MNSLSAQWPLFWSPPLFLTLAGIWALVVVGLVFSRRQAKKEYLDFFQQDPAADREPPDLVGVFDQPSEHDLLGFDALSKAISGLLRNKATQAPYSIVLSGGWGTGKSSVMAQVRREISQHGPRTHWLWFNVWHFQSGQHLLASFLGSILSRCEETSNSFFHLNLLWRRFQNQGFWESAKTTFSFFLLLPVGLYLLYSLLHIKPLRPVSASLDLVILPLNKALEAEPTKMGQLITSPFRLLSKSPELLRQAHPGIIKGDPKLPPTEGVGKPEAALWASLLAWGGALLALRKELFSKDSVLTNLVPMERFKLEAARADPGFRSKYQREFREVMRAAPPGTQFVVFIDDIDRIAGERVLELLESINFISDTAGHLDSGSPNSGKLFFIMGMNVPEVVRTLAHVLDPGQKLTEEEAQKKAADYLAKLVDLVVPMPDLQNCSKDQVASLLFGPGPTGTARQKSRFNYLRNLLNSRVS